MLTKSIFAYAIIMNCEFNCHIYVMLLYVKFFLHSQILLAFYIIYKMGIQWYIEKYDSFTYIYDNKQLFHSSDQFIQILIIIH